MNLKDKTILITGATGGIGSVLSQKLTDLGANVLTVGRDPKKLATYHADLSDRTSRQELITQVLANHPQLDVLINCAGIGIYQPLATINPTQWYDSYELNVHTPLFLLQALKPTLTVNIGSCSALQHVAQRSLYNSTKAALRSLSLCLSQELPGQVTHITLDSTLTPFGPLSLAEKEIKQQDGKAYLSPSWVADQILIIITSDHLAPEYCLSPECYDKCGVWLKP